jgi:hypothetical protein
LVPNGRRGGVVGLQEARGEGSSAEDGSQPAIFSELPGITHGAQSQRSSHER